MKDAKEKAWDAADRTLGSCMSLSSTYNKLNDQERVIFRFVIRDRILLERNRSRKRKS